MRAAILLIYFVVTLHRIDCFLRCNCDKATCMEAKDCKTGVRPDMCNCCMVCAKEEGQSCGGPNDVEGQCGEDLQCMVRHVKSRRNKMKSRVDDLIGRCEFLQCHQKRCGIGKSCRMINGTSVCVCSECTGMMNKSVCGERNNKEYANECELRKEECETGREIGLIESACVDKNVSRVTCGEDFMRIEILKSFIGKRYRRLSLIDWNCSFQENGTHVYFDTKLNACGTKITYTLTSVIYSNVVRSTSSNPDSLIIRRKQVQIPFECEYSLQNRNRIKLSTQGEIGDRIIERLSGNGVGVRIREVDTRRSSRSLNEGLKVDINPVEKYVVELKSKSLTEDKKYLKVCYVTPVSKTQRWMKYTLIEDGCPVENGVEIMKSQYPIIRLSIPGVKFRGARYPGVLVKCRIRPCVSKEGGYLCQKQCPETSNKRKKREFRQQKKLLTALKKGDPYIHKE